ncbi:MAG: 6-bladed beta-propeller [Marinifilaceae bacterium]
MRMKVFIVLLIALCFSCKRGVNNEIVIDKQQNAQLSDYIKSSHAVVLETNGDSYIRNVEKIILYQNLLFILDSDKVVVFDNQGKYISKIDKKGRGYGEYLGISDIGIFDNRLYILSGYNKMIYVYNFSGDFLDNIKLNDFYNKFEVVASNRIFLYSEKSNQQMFNINVADGNGEIINQFLPFKKTNKYNFGVTPFNRIDSTTFLLTFPYDQSLYSVTANACKLLYSFNFQTEYNLERDIEDYSYSELSDEFNYKNILKRIRCTYQKDGKLYVLAAMFYDGIGSRDLFVSIDLKTSNQKIYRFGDTIDEQYPFIGSIIAINDNMIYSWTPALNIKGIEKICGITQFPHLQETDNPVIFISELN